LQGGATSNLATTWGKLTQTPGGVAIRGKKRVPPIS